MIRQVLIRFSQTAIGLDTPVPKLSLDPFTQLLHHRAAMFLVILELLLIAHPLRLVVVLVDFPNRLHYLSALDGEDLFEFLEQMNRPRRLTSRPSPSANRSENFHQLRTGDPRLCF